jgi:hypothetical protein
VIAQDVAQHGGARTDTADELSRSIADLAAANSRLAAEQNRVYELGLRILLESSLKNFENKLRLP